MALMALMVLCKLEARKMEGKIIYQTDTVDVVFNIPVKLFSGEPNFQRLQYKVKYYNKAGKQQALKPHEAIEIQFKFGNENIRMLSRDYSMGMMNPFSFQDRIFLKLDIDGELKLFNYYYTSQTPGTVNASGVMTGGLSYSDDHYLLQKGDGEIKSPRGLAFKKDMAEYFSDCPALVEKIQDKEFRKKDLEFIVQFYNTICK